MRVLVGPDGSLAAAAIAAGWRAVAPGDEVLVRPLSDGGRGFLDALVPGLPSARRIGAATCDPLGRPVTGEVLLTADRAYVEAAQACGSGPAGQNLKITTSYGLGLLLTAAVELGAREVVVGLGAAATLDGGAGMLAALDAAPLDAGGYALPYGAAALTACDRLGGVPRLRDARVILATDVDAPLTGLHGAASRTGAARAEVLLLDAALERYAAVLERDLPGCPPGLAALPGAGAAGGVGAAGYALGGRREPGIGLVRAVSGLDATMDRADLVVTGTALLDHRALQQGVVATVAAAALERGLPCVVLARELTAGRRDAASIGVTSAYPLPAEGGLHAAGAQLARQWSR